MSWFFGSATAALTPFIYNFRQYRRYSRLTDQTHKLCKTHIPISQLHKLKNETSNKESHCFFTMVVHNHNCQGLLGSPQQFHQPHLSTFSDTIKNRNITNQQQ